jgi:hypothetical protein
MDIVVLGVDRLALLTTEIGAGFILAQVKDRF